MQSRAVQHDPKVVHFDAENLADLFALQTVNLSQSESTSSALRQRRETVVEYFPEVVTLDQLRWRCMPLIRRVISVPMALPWSGSFKELAMLRAFIRFFAEWGFAANAPEMIHDLMFQDTDQPGTFRAAPFELLIGLEGSEKSLLHCILRGGIVAQAKNGILEKIIAVIVQPTTRIGGFFGGLTLRCVHTVLNFLGQ